MFPCVNMALIACNYIFICSFKQIKDQASHGEPDIKLVVRFSGGTIGGVVIFIPRQVNDIFYVVKKIKLKTLSGKTINFKIVHFRNTSNWEGFDILLPCFILTIT